MEIWIDAEVQKIHTALAWETAHWPGLRARLARVLAAEAVPARPVPDDLDRLTAVLGGLRARARERQVRADFDSLAAHLAEARRAGRRRPAVGRPRDRAGAGRRRGLGLRARGRVPAGRPPAAGGTARRPARKARRDRAAVGAADPGDRWGRGRLRRPGAA
ncbi:hypothetical protein LUX73_41410 [Actinomadura madurae]|nr:hypothetical protein [Actinomadura madurae]MCQ0010523.1 hypothetical protein [Actinomadura madurae]